MIRTLGFKAGAIALLILLLMIPLTMIDGLVTERQRLRDGVLTDIARSSSYAQQLNGPLLVVPYRKRLTVWNTREDGSRYAQEQEVAGRLYLLPERFAVDGRLTTEARYRGIYQARLYHGVNRFSGQFAVPERFGLSEAEFPDYAFEAPFLALGVSDIRGIRNDLRLELDGQRIAFEPGSGEARLGSGVHAPLPALDGTPQDLAFAFDLDLQGSEQLSINPIGRDSRIMLASDWPHPSFFGEYLPSERESGDHGFSARWQTSFFATNQEEAVAACAQDASCQRFPTSTLGVAFIDPVDHYLKSERAIKYALLFILLTFAVFFLFEVIGRRSVHPVQYALAGLSLALFYLLLLSLSEHLGFGPAYGLSAGACVLLNGYYASHVLRGRTRGLGFGAALATLYGLLYGLLGAEDYALLLGSLLVFGLLAGTMALTRRVDWYGLNVRAAD
ncbi:cell envelope integrity protein CreD [Pseudomonas mangiferae]|uniref:Cell envelope integrity protein CreD n=1 Tax=Pseudomonas mangiferae TaxID=2593654 RepID=A0A553H054_9PSED|nr:cell envelope integrity protein CreD [Pseudomonas mangiferae]TRX75134.1 cell envelope integrity protein CreD [Pseudomonas mangiferae]